MQRNQLRCVSAEEIICGVEIAIRDLPKPEAEDVRQDVSSFLRNSSLPKDNLCKAERIALKRLKNPDNVVPPADKGKATVVLD